MADAANRVFLSYRRDDAAGYAGRLEEALERRLGRGSVFRDVQDIAPGEDFVRAIRARLAGAQAVLVLIGPRWAGGGVPGQQRIDDPQDMVRLEVATALDAGLRVIPVLLQGAPMPAADALPAALKPLATRNAMALSDAHWDADIGRLVQSLSLGSRRRVWPWALGGAALAAAVVGAICAFGPRAPAGGGTSTGASAGSTAASAAGLAAASAGRGAGAPSDTAAGAATGAAIRAATGTPAGTPAGGSAAMLPPEAQQRLVGAWSAEVTYGWGARYTERFEFRRHAGELTGTASYLGYPRGIEKLQFDGRNLHFDTHTQESLGERSYELTHRYSAELHGTPPDEVLALRLHTTGGYDASRKPLEFDARRAGASQASSTAAR